MKSRCPGCHKADARKEDEDHFCAGCRRDLEAAERLCMYDAVLDALADEGVVVVAVEWVGEA